MSFFLEYACNELYNRNIFDLDVNIFVLLLYATFLRCKIYIIDRSTYAYKEYLARLQGNAGALPAEICCIYF